MNRSDIADATPRFPLTRRDFLVFSALSGAGWMAGCAANPVTGQSQLMLVSESQEVDLDRQYAPQQFSADYGVSQDRELNAYVNDLGQRLAALSHRPQMPYRFQVVNAVYVNAYAFPGGSIAATRGILLGLDNEAELCALLGHELGHVNARHTAQQVSKGKLTQVIVGGLSMAAGAYGNLASQLGMVASGALLASYSRENERQADALGMAYMTRAGYSAQGMVGLMDVLRRMNREKPNALELMFATHPMSDERYQTAVAETQGTYRNSLGAALNRERYMDLTAGLRARKGAIEAMQNAEKELARKNYPQAEALFKQAILQAPRDYALLTMMAKCQLAQEKSREALEYAQIAQQVYPEEAQAHLIAGYCKLQARRFQEAHGDLATYDRLLPGNPTVLFFKGFALEGMERRRDAAEHYYRYLQQVQEGEQARYAKERLVQWGYLR